MISAGHGGAGTCRCICVALALSVLAGCGGGSGSAPKQSGPDAGLNGCAAICAGCCSGTTCLPGNVDNACGSAGGDCDDCAARQQICGSTGACVCEAESDPSFCARLAKKCGSVVGADNCGRERTANCGSCGAGEICAGNQCVCAPEADSQLCARLAKKCGSVSATDNCGSARSVDCGACALGESCAENQCVCIPETAGQLCTRLGKKCGTVATTDNCDGGRTVDCGACADGQICANNQCVCAPESDVAFCSRLGKQCGSAAASDNCDHARTVDCGTCAAGQSCADNHCVCVAEDETALCARLGKHCGTVAANDNCGRARTADCGICAAGQACSDNQCVCAPETDAVFCGRLGKHCGSVAATDNCGTTRTAPCGECKTGELCDALNQCVCAAESNSDLCRRLGATCGTLSAVDNCGAQRTVSCGSCDDGNACTSDFCQSNTCHHVDVLACGQACGPQIACGYADADGDGLNDVWEQNGYIDLDCNGRYDAGTDTPLPGSDKKRPNVYVKLDYMVKSGTNAHSHQPSADALALAKDAFAQHNAILTIHSRSTALPEHAVVSLAQSSAMDPTCSGSDAVSLYDLKAANFPAYLRPAYHYAVFAHYNTCQSSSSCASCAAPPKTAGETPDWLTSGTATGIAEQNGNDMIISLGGFVTIGSPITDLDVAGTFLHQLGHNLGLRHGGGDDFPAKPNYRSAMNISYQFGIGIFQVIPDWQWSVDWATPAAGYVIDYSDMKARTLYEGAFSATDNACVADGSAGLDETAGLALTGSAQNGDVWPIVVFTQGATGDRLYAPGNGWPIDWDADGSPTNVHLYQDVNGDGLCNVLEGFNDWAQSSPAAGVTKLTNMQPSPQCQSGHWAD